MSEIEVVENKTLRHLICYRYARILALGAFAGDRGITKDGFVNNISRELVNSHSKMLDLLNADDYYVENDSRCAYCNSAKNLSWQHIITESLFLNEDCSQCDVLQTFYNLLLSCEKCSMEKGLKGLYKYYSYKYPGDERFFDKIPPMVEKKYLKSIYSCHSCRGTLDWDGDGELLTLLDLDL